MKREAEPKTHNGGSKLRRGGPRRRPGSCVARSGAALRRPAGPQRGFITRVVPEPWRTKGPTDVEGFCLGTALLLRCLREATQVVSYCAPRQGAQARTPNTFARPVVGPWSRAVNLVHGCAAADDSFNIFDACMQPVLRRLLRGSLQVLEMFVHAVSSVLKQETGVWWPGVKQPNYTVAF